MERSPAVDPVRGAEACGHSFSTPYDAALEAGAGVVADSVPEYEFEETMNKSRAVLTAIDLAREGVD